MSSRYLVYTRKSIVGEWRTAKGLDGNVWEKFLAAFFLLFNLLLPLLNRVFKFNIVDLVISSPLYNRPTFVKTHHEDRS